MDVQVITRDGQPEYAVLPWTEYQALLQAAGRSTPANASPAEPAAVPEALPALTELPGLRQAKGLEAAALARLVGISPAYLEMIERGERQPDAAIRRSLAWQVGVAGWQEAP